MSNEAEDEELEEGLEYIEIEEGKLLIFDLDEFKTKTSSLAVHVTMDDGVFILGDDLVWKSYPVETGKSKPRPKPTLVR